MTTTTSSSTAVAQKQAKPIDTVREVFEKMKPQFAMALPKHITPDRMVRVALTAIQNTPKLLECDKQSLYSAVMRSAQLGLEPDGVLGQAYLIPFAGKVQFIVGYKGLIDLARRSGEVSNIIAKEVCANDIFKITWHDEIPFRHEQPSSGVRGDVIGFWALARFKDGGFHWDYMTIDEIRTVRDQSSGWQSAKKYNKTAESPWEKHFNEMAKKTVIRRIAKYLPMSVQKAAAVEDLIDAGKKFTADEYGEIIIEGDVIDATEAVPEKKRAKKLDNFAGEQHDPATGEVIEQNAAAAKSNIVDDVPAALRQPRAITTKPLASDTTKTDWEAFSVSWGDAVSCMVDAQSLEKLRDMNQKNIDVLERESPPKFNWCLECYSERMVKVGGVHQAAA